MADSPFWIAFGDLHDDLSRLDEIPDLAQAEGVLITGDMTLGGGVKQAARVMAAVAERNPKVYAQIGNMDRVEVNDWLEEHGWNLHARSRELFPGVMALGVGCSPFTPFGTPSEYPESRLYEWMVAGLAEIREAAMSGGGMHAPHAGPSLPRLVLVSHTPPHNSACDRLDNGTAVGSTAVREFIEEHQPDVCVCGHIHESRGEDLIGRTHVINPGTLGAGGYVVIRKQGEGQGARAVAELRMLP